MSIPHESTDGYVQKVLDEAFAKQKACLDTLKQDRKTFSFCQRPEDYIWRYVGRGQRILPFNWSQAEDLSGEDASAPNFPDFKCLKWQKHDVWIVDGILKRGESNILLRRLLYIDAISWLILMGEGFDDTEQLVSQYLLGRLNVGRNRHLGRWYNAP